MNKKMSENTLETCSRIIPCFRFISNYSSLWVGWPWARTFVAFNTFIACIPPQQDVEIGNALRTQRSFGGVSVFIRRL